MTTATVPPDQPALFSVGYQGRSIDDLVGLLVSHRVTNLLDVRLNPISRRAGFSKRHLQEALGAAGVGYRHARALGNPKENRQPFRSGDTGRGLAVIHRLLAEVPAQDELARLDTALHKERVAVLCFERDHDRCHRRAVVDMALEKNRAPFIRLE